MTTTDVPAERERDELRPCPFCGEEPHLHEPAFVGDDWQVGCQCGDDEDERNPGAIWRNGKTFEEVASRWNRRAAPQEAREPEAETTFAELVENVAKAARMHGVGSQISVDAQRAVLAAARPAPETREPDRQSYALSREARELWDAINDYATACGGDPSRYVYGNTPRQLAVAAVERAVRDTAVYLGAPAPAEATERSES